MKKIYNYYLSYFILPQWFHFSCSRFTLVPGLVFIILVLPLIPRAQAPAVKSAADIYLQLQKLNVLGSVLYIAAHPDDENTRLLAYLSKDRLYRTGYLSLTRGDGGQNLIGDEQGIELGLIRTQELLSARRIDGAEQFFSRAYDFGFSKSTEEALKIWGRQKILQDVVWVIRKFQPDVIITRFPEDKRAGHGQHSGSAVLAHEAFSAAADPSKFPEQFTYGVKPWQAKRILWNTYRFGGNNTTSEDQLKFDVGGFNPVIGKSYGEISSLSRSQHKSQGFGMSASRGTQLEYFSLVQGDPVSKDLMDGVNTGWARVAGAENIGPEVNKIIEQYSLMHPDHSVPALAHLYKDVSALPESYWKNKKLTEIRDLIEDCSGIWMEASSGKNFAIPGDPLDIDLSFNNRSGVKVNLVSLKIDGYDSTLNLSPLPNRNYDFSSTLTVADTASISQPYWLAQPMDEGSYNVADQRLIGKPQNDPAYRARFLLDFDGVSIPFEKPVFYKYADPVKGEVYEPLVIEPAATVSVSKNLVVLPIGTGSPAEVMVSVTANKTLSGYKADIYSASSHNSMLLSRDSSFSLQEGSSKSYGLELANNKETREIDTKQGIAVLKKNKDSLRVSLSMKTIQYGHIPDIHYFYPDKVKVVKLNLKTEGKKIGYINGAGDKVAVALRQMGYEVTELGESDLTAGRLKQFDAIITGVRAYNVHPFLSYKYSALMNYVKNGGNLIVQYNTNNRAGPINARIGPYPFTISRSRVTDENAAAQFLIPDHRVLNYPNKITAEDFKGWIQERGIYFAEEADAHYQAPLAMHDPGEDPANGSLIITNYGKGVFVYTGLVFFRELPAGVPGAFRLMANIIALNKKKPF